MQRFKKILTDYKETFTVLVGELVVSLLVAAVYLLIGEFDYTVPLGLLLGSGVTVLNIFALSIAVNRRINKFLELRGTREMSEEEADAFAAEEEILAVLRRGWDDSPQHIADALLQAAMIQKDGMPPDDMTVLCARVCQRHPPRRSDRE